MPVLEINNVNINYEIDGNGEETLVLLNGIMMSTASWAEFVPFYTKNNYRILRMDFRDQGMSSKYEEDYDVSIHVNDLKDLLDKLDIDKIHLLGVSYGATVAMLFAIKYPQYLNSLILPNAVAKATKYLQAVSDIWEEAARLNSGELFFKLSMPLIYSDDFYNRKWDWLKEREKNFDQLLKEPWFESLIRLSRSSKKFDIMDKIDQIMAPTLLIAGNRDIITPPYEMRKIRERIENSSMVIIENAGHASFYEKMVEFNSIVLGFLKQF